MYKLISEQTSECINNLLEREKKKNPIHILKTIVNHV